MNKTPANIYILGLKFSIIHFKDIIKYVVNKYEKAKLSLKYARSLTFPLLYNIFKSGN